MAPGVRNTSLLPALATPVEHAAMLVVLLVGSFGCPQRRRSGGHTAGRAEGSFCRRVLGASWGAQRDLPHVKGLGKLS